MTFKILITLLLISAAFCGDYEKDGNVLMLDNESLEEALEEFDSLFVKFFAP